MSNEQSESKPRLAIVSSYNICCGIAFYAEALRSFLTPSFDVEIIDLKTSELLRQEGETLEKMSELHIDQICERLQNFDLVNVQMEIGIFGTKSDLIVQRIHKICAYAKRLVLTIHSIDYKENNSGFSHIHKTIIDSLKHRSPHYPYYFIAHLPKENTLFRKHFGLSNVTDFPILFLTNEKRQTFLNLRNSKEWKKQFGFKENDIIIGMFGLISKHKNYTHALKTLEILPPNYKLLIVGEAHHMNIREWKIDETILEITSYLDTHPLLGDRVFFTGKRDEKKYYEDLANVDFVLLPSYEVGQAATGGLSTALELSCAILKSNTLNTIEHQDYFPNCFETFDIGNYYETRNKILNFDKSKLENLKNTMNSFTESQVREMYIKIYHELRSASIDLHHLPNHSYTPLKIVKRSLPTRLILRFLPTRAKNLLKKIREKIMWNYGIRH